VLLRRFAGIAEDSSPNLSPDFRRTPAPTEQNKQPASSFSLAFLSWLAGPFRLARFAELSLFLDRRPFKFEGF
jgi:hypothetical protein